MAAGSDRIAGKIYAAASPTGQWLVEVGSE
jgi:hypothetical protein